MAHGASYSHTNCLRYTQDCKKILYDFSFGFSFHWLFFIAYQKEKNRKKKKMKNGTRTSGKQLLFQNINEMLPQFITGSTASHLPLLADETSNY